MDDLPLSSRLEAGLRNLGIRQLGDLERIYPMDLMALPNFGAHSLKELFRLLERVEAGEFDVTPEEASTPACLLSRLDLLMDKLPKKQQELMAWRLGGHDGSKKTLEEVGRQFHLTRERVRQVVNLAVTKLLKEGSRMLRDWLEGLEAFCCEEICPLTPALIEQWRGTPPLRLKYQPAFYVRLLEALNPNIPAWPDPFKVDWSVPPRIFAIQEDLMSLWKLQTEDLPLPAVYEQLCAMPQWQDLDVGEFLEALRANRVFPVEFPEPDAPVLRSPLPVAAG